MKKEKSNDKKSFGRKFADKRSGQFGKKGSGKKVSSGGSQRTDELKDELEEETFIIVGKNPVLEALRSEQAIDKLLILKDNTDHVLKKIADQAKKKNIIVQSTEKAKLESLADGQVHQGIVAMMAPFPYCSVDDILNKAKKHDRDPFIVILDHLTDPHNLGAIIRSANLCGVDGVIIPKRRSATLTATSVKASSGAVAHTLIAKVNNLSQVIESLKKNGVWVAAADMDGQAYYNADFKGALAVVIGNEGSGISQNVKKLCDFSVSIPIYGEIESFNASAAAAIIFSEAAKQRNR
ncbi:23S rRNA (guanosine(2251)-2'-O)-methyltransferase RlmB [Eubacteriaceae bacterium ES3]|nr:23S rRNA (guanosine(2251)-2'-O)-methyltransferase RlmB [Eubacteriaceae bacterium ES3]